MKTFPIDAAHASRRHLIARVTLAAALVFAGLGLARAADSATEPVKAAVNKTERVMSDSWVTTKVKSELLADSLTKGFKVSVKTWHGAVTLKGKLPNREAIGQVKAIAEKVQGVKSVSTSGLRVSTS